MIVNFNAIPEQTLPAQHGEGEMTVKFFADRARKVIPTRLHPGAEIGYHAHENSEEVDYVLYGTGVAVCDGVEEALATDVCHICPAGSEHSIRNTGNVDLVMLTVVHERNLSE